MFFYEQTTEALKQAILEFEKMKFDKQEIRKHAMKFDEEEFRKKIKNFVEEKYKEYTKVEEE